MKAKRWIAWSGIVSVTALGFYWMIVREKKKLEAMKVTNDHLEDNYHLLSHWLEIENQGKSLSEFFKDMGYVNIAIYGMGELANRLMEDLEGSGIHVIYGIDRDAGCCVSRTDSVYSLQEELPDADAVVVTPYYAYESIRHDLNPKVSCPVISIEEVVWSV